MKPFNISSITGSVVGEEVSPQKLTDEALLNEHLFNYRISCRRRGVQIAFGILASRFQLLQSTMQHEHGVVMGIVTASVVLHNLLSLRWDREQFQPEHMDVDVQGVLQENNLPYVGRNPTEAGKALRSVWADFLGVKELWFCSCKGFNVDSVDGMDHMDNCKKC